MKRRERGMLLSNYGDFGVVDFEIALKGLAEACIGAESWDQAEFKKRITGIETSKALAIEEHSNAAAIRPEGAPPQVKDSSYLCDM
jgi:hypothetical protein